MDTPLRSDLLANTCDAAAAMHIHKHTCACKKGVGASDANACRVGRDTLLNEEYMTADRHHGQVRSSITHASRLDLL